MRKMLVLSVTLHLLLAGAMVGLSSRRIVHPLTALQVDLVTLPAPPAKVIPPKPEPPKPVVEKKPEPVKAKPKPEPLKSKKSPPEESKPKPEPLKSKKSPPEEPKPAAPVPAAAEQEPAPPEKTEPAPPATEQAAVQSPSVSSVTAGVDIPNFEFPYYLRIIQGKIGALWSPPAAGSGREAREVVISFVLGPNGIVRDVNVEKSSGNVYYDQAAMRAVFMANPMPPLPKGFKDPSLKVHFSFVLAQSG